MNRIAKALLTIGTVAAAALALGIFAPKAADAQDHHPYTATCSADVQAPVSCILSPSPPPNAAAVIQSVDISLNAFSITTPPATPLYGFVTGYHETTNPPAVTYVPFTIAPGPTATWVAHELTAINVDPNRTLSCNAVELNLMPDVIITCTVSGFLIEQEQ